jgi:hypothetical protein
MKVLLFDIETAPNLAYVWDKYEQDVIAFKKERYMLSFSYKWLGDAKIHAYSLPMFKGYKKNPEDDKELVRKLHQLFEDADIIVAHNGDNFDIKMANAAFARHGLTPPAPYKTVDTLKVARAKFRFNSNKLDDIGSLLGLGRKHDTGGFKLWLGCLAGLNSAWKKMVDYNKQDVVLLEKVYLKLRPWMTNHPNMNLDDGKAPACPVCKSTEVIRRGFAYTSVSRRQRYCCADCGKWSVGKIQKVDVEIR